jgi:hypothetical protein
LRQIFRKLSIGSRVELTRLAIEDGQRQEHGHGHGHPQPPPAWRPSRGRQQIHRRNRG